MREARVVFLISVAARPGTFYRADDIKICMMPKMKYQAGKRSTRRSGAHFGTTVLRVVGELNYVNSDELSAAIENAAGASARNVIVDFMRCRSIDSSVLTVLAASSSCRTSTGRSGSPTPLRPRWAS